MNVHELGTWLLSCPDQELPACTVNQHGDAEPIHPTTRNESNWSSLDMAYKVDIPKYMRVATESGSFGQDINGLRAQQLETAIRAAKNAYCPYSKFHVGAALLTITSNIYGGCNVENVMYNGMSHAELTAISNAIVHEGSDILIMEMTVWTPTDEPRPCCGACRQLIREHAASDEVIVWVFCLDPTVPPEGMMVKELLPKSFGPDNIS